MVWPRQKYAVLPLVSSLLLCACGVEPDVGALDFEAALSSLGPARGVLQIVSILVGLVLLVAGWKIYRMVVILPGFVIGAALGAWLGHRLVENWQLTIMGLMLGGLGGIWLANIVHNLALFSIGGVGGGYILISLWGVLLEPPPPIWAVIVSGIVGGGVLLALSKHWTVFLSSAIGATMLVWGLQGGPSMILVLFLLGVALQYGMSRSFGKKAFARQDRSK